MKTVIIVASIAAAVFLLIIAVCLYIPHFIFNFVFGKPKRSTKVPKSYKDSPHYKVSRKGMELMKTYGCEDVYITSRDGFKLHAYLFKAPNQPAKKFVLGIHGYKSYARPEYGPFIEFYRSLGYSMLLPDDRAHAPSEGKYIGFGVLDRLDCVDWSKYIVERFGSDSQIYLHGVSMGSATVLAASGEEDLPVQVKGIIADCGYDSARNILAYQMKHTAHLPVKPFLSQCEAVCKKKAGFAFNEFTPVEQVKKAKVPILFIHGEDDTMVPVEMAHTLYDACASKKKLLIVKNAKHAESIAIAPDEYRKTVREFFNI